MHDGYCYKYDVSLPLSHFYTLVEDMRVRLEGNATRVVAYGHVGDGKAFLNMKLFRISMLALFSYDYFSYFVIMIPTLFVGQKSQDKDTEKLI